ncbi:MAG: thiol-disulfide isomerase [Bryobacterales bacterium]|nr:thiol-disulfide isomerase [Bryobacterales bacterium]
MPLETFAQARPWAKAIREAVLSKRMPPWFADPRYGHFANDPTLTEAERKALIEWASYPVAGRDVDVARRPGGLPHMNLRITAPRPFRIPAGAEVPYQFLILPLDTSIPRWVSAIHLIPKDRAVVHHAVLYVRERSDPWLRSATPGVYFTADGPSSRTTSDILAVYTPGSGPVTLRLGMAKLIPAGADLILQIHYTAKPKQAAVDQMQVALRWYQGQPTHRVLTLQMGNDHIRIPPGDGDYRLSVSGTLPQPALLLSMLPHMHLRGSAFEYQIAGASGRVETLLRVKPYNFYWQIHYQLAEPRPLAAGARLLLTAYYDNSPNNPRNPDPDAEVTWGEQSWQEMMIGFFDVAVPPDMDKRHYFTRP